jgi:competence protein ComFC
MVEVHPVRIPGRWDDGRALDVHTVSSTYLGDDEFGHAQFETVRSPVGELLYRLKYRGDWSVVSEIAETAAAFVREWGPPVDLVIPVPASRERPRQPVIVVGAEIARQLGAAFNAECVRRTRAAAQLKDVFDYDQRWILLDGLHEADERIVREKRVLLFDDLFRSGATMNSVSALLTERAGATAVYALTLTRTRSAR